MLKRQAIKIFEVGPRDGLQNESNFISTDIKVKLIHKLIDSGVKHIESTAFVSPKWVPQMADASQVLSSINQQPNIVYSALVPNLHGFKKAIDSGATESAIFISASDTFSQKNTNRSIQQSMEGAKDIVALAQTKNIPVRAYLSTVFGCPYQGTVDSEQVISLCQQLYEMGCYEISLGDTIGIGTANHVTQLINELAIKIPIDNIAVHFHDTYGQALINIYAALQCGIKTIDSSVGGLGGCPYAKGATGNVATEDVVYLLNGLGLESGIDLNKICEVGHWITEIIGTTNHSKVGQALAF